jgi:hypothetical protein
MTVQVTPTRAFLKDLKGLGGDENRRDQVISSLQQFLENPRSPGLNFERVKSQKGYFTIRASIHDRVLLREVAPGHYEASAVGNHDYIYVSFFRGR